MFSRAAQLLDPTVDPDDARRLLKAVGFADASTASQRLRSLATDPRSREPLADCLPTLLTTLSEAATPDAALLNFERLCHAVADRADMFRFLAEQPRAAEILVKLFVGSQYLTEILLRNPQYLVMLTQHHRLADLKSRDEFTADARAAIGTARDRAEWMDALRRYQHWELLRIGACDAFGLMDLKTVTVQLSLLADALVQTSLTLSAEELQIDPAGFAVLALGKLGGEELNYSSDIDLVLIARNEATPFWPLGQRLIKALQDATGEGFLYRVDVRLRPWGRSGPLVTSVPAYLDYLKKHATPWEKQALIKARVIAGDLPVGEMLLRRAEAFVYSLPSEVARTSVRDAKRRIEADLNRRGRSWGDVKSGEGSIRDVEFTVQYLQLVHGAAHREVRSFNTLDALVRLADSGLLPADEYRQLTDGYIFLRSVEHSLQLMHNKQVHALPRDRDELTFLARRLDFATSEQFLAYYKHHGDAIRAIYARHLQPRTEAVPASEAVVSLTLTEPDYARIFSAAELDLHRKLLRQLSAANPGAVAAEDLGNGTWRVTVAGYDYPGDLSVICGLLFVYGFDIVSGQVFTDRQLTLVPQPASSGSRSAEAARMFVNVFTVRPPLDTVLPEVWDRYQSDLVELFALGRAGRQREAQGRLAKRVSGALRETTGAETRLFPVEIEVDNSACDHATVLNIRSEDTIGFLYELSNALSLSGIDIERVLIRSQGRRVFDTLYVTDAASGEKITDPARQQQLRAAVVLIKHFTHLLPHSPNPEAALLHFREFLEQLFRQPNWHTEISSLERSDVLDALARLLGVSDFLWEDFLRLQYSSLFPVVTDLAGLSQRKDKATLAAELAEALEAAGGSADKRLRLNTFKDREMFRTDMRHILGQIAEFGQFSAELTDVAEVVVEAGLRICEAELHERYGIPTLRPGRICPLSLCALGKCGGRELGFASDIELMFVFEGDGQTTGPEVITNAQFFNRLVESFTNAIQAKREGIFHIDLRLRPYGRAGSLAVPLEAFEHYFGTGGPAWPFERQALVKLRPIAGDAEFGRLVTQRRDRLIYTGEPFDATAMRAMRERQVRQLVQAGTFHAKLSPGGLADCEYLVQGLQITYGHRDPALRATNTHDALSALHAAGILDDPTVQQWQSAYIFLRRLIDALRMVRGDARDLTVPPPDSEEFEFLARRLGYDRATAQLQSEIEKHTRTVLELSRWLETIAQRRDADATENLSEKGCSSLPLPLGKGWGEGKQRTTDSHPLPRGEGNS